MEKLTATKNLPREEWLKWRKMGIGGSDAGAVCGLNPYRTALEVYLDKTSDSLETSDSEAMRQGREFEDYVARPPALTWQRDGRTGKSLYPTRYNAITICPSAARTPGTSRC